MKKLLALLLSAVLMLSLLTGCRSNQVQTEPDGTEEGRPADENTQTEQDKEATTDKTETDKETAKTEGAVKTGLAVAADLSGSRSAGEEAGLAQYDIALVAVTVDDNGVITDCVIDGIHTGVDFDQTGTITSDLTVAPQTRNEMKEQDESGWHEAAASLADSVVGKTVDELKNGTAGEGNTDKTEAGQDAAEPNADNADQASADAESGAVQDSAAAINSDTYIKAIEKAVSNAAHLGAQEGDELVLAAMSNWDKSAAATEEAEGSAQLDITMTALTKKDGVITSCVIDGLQAPVNFDKAGAVTSDLNTELRTKNELGEEYGMKEYAGSKYEWNEQAAYFAKYVTGKTADEVKGIDVNEYGVPANEDLASTVTIKVGGFMELIEKAAR